MKVLFLIHDLGHGGAEKVLVNLVNNMDPNKFDITVMTLFDEGVNRQFLAPHIKYKSCFKKAVPGNCHLLKLLTPKQLHKWLIKDYYDVEISYLEGPSARVISGCDNKKTKLISWIHVEQKNKKAAAWAFRNYAESCACYQKFNKIICVSEATKRDFCTLYDCCTDVSVLYNTNESKKIINLSRENAEDMSNATKQFRIVGVGKIIPNKGFDRLARIHNKLIKEGFDVHTFILGVGDMETQIQAYLSENDLTDTFTFLGYQTNPYKYVSKCDLFVCTSYAEGFSTAATEALIVGTPVCTVDVSGMKEMLGEHNEYGIVTRNDENDLYEAIKMLLMDKELLLYYKEQAIKRGKDFVTEKTVCAVEVMLEGIFLNEN